MARRKRKHLALAELLASALVLRLPKELQDELRRTRVPASKIRSMFSPDHARLHALGGSDKWWNIYWMDRASHDVKSPRDTTETAKTRRIAEAHHEHVREMRRKMLAPKPREDQCPARTSSFRRQSPPGSPPRKWPPGRKLQSRPMRNRPSSSHRSSPDGGESSTSTDT